MTDDSDDDIDRDRDVLAQLNDAAVALRDTLDMFVDDDLDSADLVIMHNIDFARTALDAATSYLADLLRLKGDDDDAR